MSKTPIRVERVHRNLEHKSNNLINPPSNSNAPFYINILSNKLMVDLYLRSGGAGLRDYLFFT
ncbi:hypothetical protein C7B69_04875 [filamentous cyanobacterium Phorm 46]|nr:hypothetical protein C7B69_04875 [filamentous cyanobacterium Phorm 46]PSB52951.1 hypothetical protein C7B67_05015 [filamentous cyanobacterium Phorm 6]